MAKKAAVKKEATERPNGKPVPKEIQLKLTAQQKMSRTESASNINREKTDLQKEFEDEEKAWKVKRAGYKNNIKLLQEQVDKMLAEVKAGTATVTETVLLVLNHDAGVAEYWFNDGGWKVIDSRPLEENERQGSLIQDRVDAMPETGQEIED